MYIGWFRDVSEEEKADRESSIRSALLTLNLERFLDEECATLDRQEVDSAIYDIPNWDYRQAHKNGQRAMLDRLRKIISVN